MFQKKDFSDCLVNPMEDKLRDNELLKSFPEFKKPLGLIPANNVFKYIICVYDKNSPFRKKFDDIIKRKTEAAMFSDFKVNEFNEFDEKYYAILICKNETVNKMILRYGRMQYSSEYSYLTTMEDLYHRQLEGVRKGEDIDTKKIKQTRDEITSTIDILTTKDRNMHLHYDLLKIIDDDSLDIYPEDIAERIAKKEPPLGRFKA